MAICQVCGVNYSCDFNIPDDIWELIKPEGKAVGSGLLCGKCIAERIESNFSILHKIAGFSALEMIKTARL